MKTIPQIAHDLLVSRDGVRDDQLTSEALAAYFLRSRCARSDLSHAVLANAGALDFWAQLERARNDINGGRIDQAEKTLDSLTPHDRGEESELLIERMRVAVRRGDAEKTIALGASLEPMREELSPSSTISFLQLLGHAHYILKDYEAAISCLLPSAHLGEQFPEVQSGFSAHGFLVKIYSEQRDLTQAALWYMAMERSLSVLGSDDEVYPDRLRSVLRAESFLAKARGQTDVARAALSECALVSLWLESLETYESSIQDLRSLGSEPNWPREALPHSHWFYLSRKSLIFWRVPKRFIDLSRQLSVARLIGILKSGEPMEASDFWQTMWKVRFNKEIHGPQLRANISKYRKFFPETSLIQEELTLRLTGGIVLE